MSRSATARALRLLTAPVDASDPHQFPNTARACAELAAMSPERRAKLERDFEQ